MERIQKIKDMERYMIESLQSNDMLRKQRMALISEKFKSQMISIQEHTKSKLEDEKVMAIEHKSKERMIELLDLQSREERTELLKQELLNIEKQTQLHHQIHELEKNQYNIPPKSRSPVSPLFPSFIPNHIS